MWLCIYEGGIWLDQADNMLNQTVHLTIATSVDFSSDLGKFMEKRTQIQPIHSGTLSAGCYFVNQNTALQPSELEEICLLSIESVFINLFLPNNLIKVQEVFPVWTEEILIYFTESH